MYNQAGSIGSLGISSTFSDAQVAAQGFVGPYLKAIAEWWEGHRVTGGHRSVRAMKHGGNHLVS